MAPVRYLWVYHLILFIYLLSSLLPDVQLQSVNYDEEVIFEYLSNADQEEWIYYYSGPS
jgi:hypothetical protein